MNTKNQKPLAHKKPLHGTPLTKENLIPILESIKDLIQSTAKSTAKGTETKLNASMKKMEVGIRQDISVLQVASTEHSRLIKGLDSQVKGLDAKIDNVRNELKDEMHQLKGEMHQMEKRLSDKIDAGNSRVDDHEVRITALEQEV